MHLEYGYEEEKNYNGLLEGMNCVCWVQKPFSHLIYLFVSYLPKTKVNVKSIFVFKRMIRNT